jgi:hypothetical protein
MEMKMFFEVLLRDKEDCNEFAQWAFGENYRNFVHGLSFMQAWNEFHGEDFLLKENGLVVEAAPKMVMLWRESKLA